MSKYVYVDHTGCLLDPPIELPETNADRIRAMTDEELAEVICCQNYKHKDDCFNTPCSECIKEWLKQEVE